MSVTQYYPEYDGVLDFLEMCRIGDENKVKDVIRVMPEIVNEKDKRVGLTPLHITAANGNKDMVDILLSVANIDCHARDEVGRQAIDMAIAIGHEGCIEAISRAMFPKSFPS